MFEFSFVKKKNSILRPLKVGSNVKKKAKTKKKEKFLTLDVFKNVVFKKVELSDTSHQFTY